RIADVVVHPCAPDRLPIGFGVARLHGVGQLVTRRVGLPASVARVAANEYRLATHDAGSVTHESGHRPERTALTHDDRTSFGLEIPHIGQRHGHQFPRVHLPAGFSPSP